MKGQLEQGEQQQVGGEERYEEAPHVVDVDAELIVWQSIGYSTDEDVQVEEQHEIWGVHREVVILVDPVIDQVHVVEDDGTPDES